MLTSLEFSLQDEKQAYVVTEVCYGGTLEDFLRVCPAHLNFLQLPSSAYLHILHKNAVLPCYGKGCLVLLQPSGSPVSVAEACVPQSCIDIVAKHIL